MIVKRLVSVFKAGGVAGVLEAVLRRLRTPYASCFSQARALIRGLTGVEIGGPSPIFAWGGLLPVYPVAGRIDNVTFARSTIWADARSEGDEYRFHPGRAPGRRIVGEGANLPQLADASYEFVLSSHMLEHTANPLRALAEWRRLLRPGGGMVLVLPHYEGTFDHRRPVTKLGHLVDDYERNVGEDDLTHVPEVLQLHDPGRNPEWGDMEAFEERMRRNPEVRAVHHHVFDTCLAVEVVSYAGFDVVAVEPLEPYHIVVLARKPAAGAAQPVAHELLNEALRTSPFATDRLLAR